MQPGGVTLDLKDHSYQLQAAPNATSSPTSWMLGTSSHSAMLAAELGLPYAFGYHIRGDGVEEAVNLYRVHFKPSAFCAEPRVLLSAIVVIGDTAEEAQRLAHPQLYFMSAFRSGEVVSPQMLVEEADGVRFPDRYDDLVAMFRRTWIIGDREQAGEQIEALARRLDLDEVMINPVAAAYRSDDPGNLINWSDLAEERILLPHDGLGIELEILLALKVGEYSQRQVVRQCSGLDRTLSLVRAEFGILLMLEGATGVHLDDVVYREVQDSDGPTRVNFSAYWREANGNPTVAPLVAILSQRYPDLTVVPNQGN